MSLELPPLIRSGVFIFIIISAPKGVEQLCFCCFLAPILKWAILDCIAHSLII